MTVTSKCFEILARADRPLSSKELAKLVGNRQTRGSIESVLYKYIPNGCLRKVDYDCDNGCKTAWIFVRYPDKSPRKPRSPSKKEDIKIVMDYMRRAKNPVTSEKLCSLLGYTSSNRLSQVYNLLDTYLRKGYIKKVPYKWGTYGKCGFVLVRMPKL